MHLGILYLLKFVYSAQLMLGAPLQLFVTVLSSEGTPPQLRSEKTFCWLLSAVLAQTGVLFRLYLVTHFCFM